MELYIQNGNHGYFRIMTTRSSFTFGKRRFSGTDEENVTMTEWLIL